MSEIKKGSFAAIAAARLASFISYREAIEKLAAATGESYGEVAAGLGPRESFLSEIATRAVAPAA
jgi:hypothetical protein